MFYRYAFLNQ